MNPYRPPQVNFKPLRQDPFTPCQVLIKICIIVPFAIVLLLPAVFVLWAFFVFVSL